MSSLEEDLADLERVFGTDLILKMVQRGKRRRIVLVEKWPK